MRTTKFLPTTDSGRELWLKNFTAKLPQYALKYGINNTELGDIESSVQNFSHYLNFTNQVREFYSGSTDFKNNLLNGVSPGTVFTPPQIPTFPAAPAPVEPGIIHRVISIAFRIKKHNAYSVSDGADLGIENPKTVSVNKNEIKPVLKLRLVETGKPEIIWKKHGMQAIQLFVDRGEGFVPLAVDLSPNYIDEHALEPGMTAVWKYKGAYLHDSKQVGQFSDEVKITVTGEHRA